MIITIPVASQAEFETVYATVAAYAIVDARQRVQVSTSDAATLVASMEEEDDPVVRVRLCNVSKFEAPNIAAPNGKQIAAFDVRMIDGETLLDNHYWYGRDCSTVGYLNVVVVDSSKYDDVKARLKAQAQAVRNGMIELIEADLLGTLEDRIRTSANAVLEVLKAPNENADPLDFWTCQTCDIKTLDTFCKVIMNRRASHAQFAIWGTFHSLVYTPASPWGLRWAYKCNYMHPFHNQTRGTGAGQYIVDVWKPKSEKKSKGGK